MKGRGVWNHNWWGDRPNDSEETKSVNIHRDWSKNNQAQFEQLRHKFRFVSCAVKKTLVKLEHPIRYIQMGENPAKVNYPQSTENFVCISSVDSQLLCSFFRYKMTRKNIWKYCFSLLVNVLPLNAKSKELALSRISFILNHKRRAPAVNENSFNPQNRAYWSKIIMLHSRTLETLLS